MSNKLGIVELMSLVTLLAILGNTGGKVAEDGKIGLDDVKEAGDLLKAYPILVKMNWSMIVPEAADLTMEEQAQLIEKFRSEFDIPQDKLEVTVESVLALIQKQAAVIAELVALMKALKSA